MAFSEIVLMLGLVAFLGYFALKRREREKTVGAAAVEEDSRTPTFHAVEVRSTREACAAARAIRGKRFLSAEAPLLPLESCNRRACTCVYAHYEDRRSLQRRDLHLHDGSINMSPRPERRVQRGRRHADRMLFGAEH